MATADATHASLPPGTLPALGDVVAGKYRIDRMIAEGGMGVVYEAMHLQLDEAVAIKFLRPDFVGTMEAELASRFLREARASAKIRSEHVTRVHDVGTLPNGAPYIVMEKLNGSDLEQLVEKQGVLPIERAIDYVLQACEALAEAHAIGIVHRDLKPANLFLTHRADGSSCVKVLDFGISKFKDAPGTGSDMGITKTQSVMGSPRYMSPEQMRSSKGVDPRADVWAIGIILYELFAGTVPFDGESMPQICAAILQDEPKSLRGLRSEIPPDLEAIVARCLEKKADNRYASIAPLSAALAEYGSAAARVSADRIGRVLKNSGGDIGFNADTVPHDFAPAAADASGPLASIRVHHPGPNASNGTATAVAWTGSETAPQQGRKRLLLFAAAAVLLVGVGIGFVAFTLHDRSTTTDSVATLRTATTESSAKLDALPQPLARPDPSSNAMPNTTPNPPNPPNAMTATTTATTIDPVAAASMTSALGTKKPVTRSAPHPATHMGSTGTTLPSSTTTASADMWGGRK